MTRSKYAWYPTTISEPAASRQHSQGRPRWLLSQAHCRAVCPWGFGDPEKPLFVTIADMSFGSLLAVSPNSELFVL